MNNKVFRKTSLDRLSSPEQLDSLVRVTNPKGWVGLLGLMAIIMMALMWSVYGSLTTHLQGEGVLISSGGLQIINSTSTGQVTDIGVASGDRVQAGDVVARIEQSEERDRLQQVQGELADLEQLEQEVIEGSDRQDSLQTDIQRLSAEADSMREQLLASSRVVSPYSGRVTEVMVETWDFLQEGGPVVVIEPERTDTQDLQAVIYIPAEEGPRVRSGMEVKLAPSGIDRETYGFMKGRVNEVGDYPATYAGMMRILNNESLVQNIIGEQVMIEVRVDLIPDSNTNSGYSWSVSNGPPFQISSGTLGQGDIVISEQQPIQIMFPDLN